MNTEQHLVIGASSGLGAEIARNFIRRMDYVRTVSRNEPPFGQDNGMHHWSECDLAKPGDILDAMDGWGQAKFQTVTIAAGHQERKASQWSLDEWQRHMQVNCFGSAMIFEECEKRNLLVDHPTVLVIGSQASQGSPWCPAYAMSKAALWSYWNCKYQQRKRALTVNLLWPGRVNTNGNPKRELPEGDPNPFREPNEVLPYILHLLNYRDTDAPSLQLLDLGAPA